jgi:hypothetical protein
MTNVRYIYTQIVSYSYSLTNSMEQSPSQEAKSTLS